MHVGEGEGRFPGAIVSRGSPHQPAANFERAISCGAHHARRVSSAVRRFLAASASCSGA